MEQKTVDAKGFARPLPVVNAKKAVGEFREDGVRQFWWTMRLRYPQKFAAQKGFAAAREKKADKEYEVTIAGVSAEAAALWHLVPKRKTDAEEVNCIPDSREKGNGCGFVCQCDGRRR